MSSVVTATVTESYPSKEPPTLVTVKALERFEKSSQASSATSSSRTTTPSTPSSGTGVVGDKRRSVIYSDGQFSITLHHYDSLVGELKCPGCAQAFYGSIWLCQTGHSICSNCVTKRSLAECPLCRKKMTDMRNYTLEAVAAKVHFPCTHASKGCTVRLPLQLLWWHKDRCGYKQIDCFMGKVWENCSWHGCEKDWIEHCVTEHQDKVYSSPDIVLTWNYAADSQRCVQLQSVIAYYVIRAYGEYFNVYQIYDQNSRRTIWTVICATKEAKTSARFAFELELYSPIDSAKLLVQRFPCHSETDADFLKDGNCAKIGIEEAVRFMTKEKILYYRVRIIEVAPCRSRSLVLISHQASQPKLSQTTNPRQLLPINYSATKIENVNMKAVPEGDIIVRQDSTQSTGSSRTLQDDEDEDVEEEEEEDEELPEDDLELRAKATSTPILNRVNSLPKPPRVILQMPPSKQEEEESARKQQEQLQQLVRCRIVERQESIKMKPIYADGAETNGRRRSSQIKASSESLNVPGAKGLSKFYNITSYKASKLWNKAVK